MTLIHSETINNLLIQNYETTTKLFILFGLFMFSMFYVFYLKKKQEPSQFFLVGTVRQILYILSCFYMWMFFLIFPIFMHPNVPIDNLLIFMFSSYSIGFTIFMIIFVANLFLKYGKYAFRIDKLGELKNSESDWLDRNKWNFFTKK